MEQGRARLYSCLEEIAGVAMQWFTEARAVRRSIDDATLKGSAHVAEESKAHFADSIGNICGRWEPGRLWQSRRSRLLLLR